ncbi:hypothetical protein EON63_06395 [archaeon]|nr:MAG: hypothetical protein EON63_06395 [archaeon]
MRICLHTHQYLLISYLYQTLFIHTRSYASHTHEVCGLAWSPDSTLLASGGNDNLLCVWDARHIQTQTQGEAQGYG